MDINALVKGFERFRKTSFQKYEDKFQDLVKQGQRPRVLFIACADSRVDPGLITDAGPGELFIMRNVGNMVEPFAADNEFHATAAGIEYAVSVLNVSNIIVCGHSHCGAISGMYKIPHGKNLVHVRKWIELAKEAKTYVAHNAPSDISHEERLELTEKMSVLFQLNHLLTYPEVKRRVDAGQLQLRGWYFSIETGEIEYYDHHERGFVRMGR
ncbi:MAG: carbonic anhydrase [Burkholderiales bacterium]|jgi:carbonic anhydrase|nr:carbonic anhydrase [Burkholderiales bacterium]